MLLQCNIIAFTKGFLQGGEGLPGEGYGVKQLVFNIHSQLFGYYSQKNIFCKRSSTLPPLVVYISDIQRVR